MQTVSGLGGLVVSALDFQAGYRGFESRSGRDNFQTIITPSSYSTCPGLSIKWTERRLVTDSGTKFAWVIHESKTVQIHVNHSNRHCLYVPRVSGSVKNPHNNNNANSKVGDIVWSGIPRTPIQIYWNFSPPNIESFQIEILIVFIFLLKT